MDAKALVKSKRAHSLHHSRRPHLNQTTKTTSWGNAGAGNAKKQSGKQIREKSHQSMDLSGLPSNRDRYEEEFDSGSEEPSISSMNPANDVILPNSKGADYSELISDAKSQSQSNPFFDGFACLDDVLPDFKQGVGSLISVRGQGILSWIGDNSFIVEDRATTSHEAPFLSLNLHSLTKQLMKVDLSERLFVEEDLLALELMSARSDQVKKSSNQEVHQMQTNKGAKMVADESAAPSFPQKDTIVDKSMEAVSCDATRSQNPVLSSPNQKPESDKEVKDRAKESGRIAQSRDLEVAAQINKVSVADPEQKRSAFDLAVAEAELDMLLGSVNKTNKFDSWGLKEKSGNAFPVFPQKPCATTRPLLRKADNANPDDALNDILEETSNLMDQNGRNPPEQVKPTPPGLQSSSSFHSGQSSKVLDDFDSWLDTI